MNKEEQFLLWFEQLERSDVAIVGGKSSSMGEMTAKTDVPVPYGFATTGADLDGAVQALAEILPLMLELAEVEKATSRLADEIEKTRRRVNALEYVMIPEMEENIKYISMKLSENENATKVRLMKVKDMVLKQAIEQRRADSGRITENLG